MSKLGFRFAAVPKDRHPEWFEVSLLARTLGLELFATIYDEKTRTAEVAVAESWTVSLCRLMRVEAKERLGACRALESLHRHGLIVIENGKASLVFRADQELGKSTSSNPQEEVKTPSREVQEQVKRSPTIGNDSTPISQTDKKEEIREEKTQSARADFGGSRVLREVLPREPASAARGAAWLSQATGGPEPYSHSGRWAGPLAELAVKPEADKAAAAKVLAVEAKKPGVLEMLTPQHVIDHWTLYRVGKAPGAKFVPRGTQPAAAEPPKTEAGKLLEKVRALERAERACLYDEGAKKERIRNQIDEVFAQMKAMEASDVRRA